VSVVAFDADVLGRQRTGDETYALNLLRELGPLAADAGIRLVAVTRRAELVPPGVEPLELAARVQELRMAWSLPRALRRFGADLCHTQHAIPLRASCACVVTVHDLSFERDPGLMSRRDRLAFRRMVPASVRKAKRVFTVSERTKADLVDLYGTPPEKIVVTPNGVDPAFHPPPPNEVFLGDYVLSVGADVHYVRSRNQRVIFEALRERRVTSIVLVPQYIDLFWSSLEREVEKRGRTRLVGILRRIARRLPIATGDGKGVNFEWLLPLSFEDTDTVSYNQDLCVKVRVYKEGPP